MQTNSLIIFTRYHGQARLIYRSMIQVFEPSKASCHPLCVQMHAAIPVSRATTSRTTIVKAGQKTTHLSTRPQTASLKGALNFSGPVSDLTPNCPSQLVNWQPNRRGLQHLQCQSEPSIAHKNRPASRNTSRSIKIFLKQSPDA